MAELLRFPRVLILMVLFSFLSLGAVVFTPAFPELAHIFDISDVDAQWMMTLYLLGTAFGRLPYGPLANRYGRKPTLFIGLFITLIGTLMILYAPNYLFLCLGRFIQACGSSVTLKIGYTMIADLHAGAAATKVLSYAMLAYAVLPGIGTSIAGFLLPFFGWKGGFWFYLIFTIGLMLSCITLPETLKQKDHEALRIPQIVFGYGEQFKDLQLVLLSSLMGLSTAVIFIFSQQAPFIAIERLGMTPQAYGVFYLVPAVGITAGSFLTAWLANRSATWGMFAGIAILFFGALAMGVTFSLHWKSGWALFLPQMVVQLGDALLYTNASSVGLSEAKDKSNASAVMLFINSMGSVLGTFFAGIFAPKALYSLPISFLIITVMMLLIWLKLPKR